jgi:hypothetical protein
MTVARVATDQLTRALLDLAVAGREPTAPTPRHTT